MSDKKLYFQFSDNADVSKVVMELSGVTTWIEEDLKGVPPEDISEFEYTITPIYLTKEEFENLPEADI